MTKFTEIVIKFPKKGMELSGNIDARSAARIVEIALSAEGQND